MRWRSGGGGLFQRHEAQPVPLLSSSPSSSSASNSSTGKGERDGSYHRHVKNFTNTHQTGYVEDYGDIMDTGKRGLGRSWGGLMAPLFCVWNCQKRMLSPHFMAAAAMLSSFLTMQFAAVDSLLVTVSSTLSVVVAMLILYQQRKIRKLGTLRHQNNELRRRARYFIQERERLHRTLGRMDEKLAQLHYVPQELHALTKNNQQSVDRLTGIVRENRTIQDSIRTKLRQKVLQQILGVVVNADRNSDWALAPAEVESLIIRLRSVPGVVFDEGKFRQILSDDTSLHAVLKVIRSLEEKDDDYEHGDPVFKIKLDLLRANNTETTTVDNLL